MGGDPERLAAVEDRLELLRALARKHGVARRGAIARRAEMRDELARLRGGGERLGELAAEIGARGNEARRSSRASSPRARAKAARAFAEAVRGELDGLAMGRCRLEVALLPPEGGRRRWTGAVLGAGRRRARGDPHRAEPGRAAAAAREDRLRRRALAHPARGEADARRARTRSPPTCSTRWTPGIGGAVAEAMGRVLAEVSRGRQVICVTHLPQVAAFADRHHRVEKRIAGGRTHARRGAPRGARTIGAARSRG